MRNKRWVTVSTTAIVVSLLLLGLLVSTDWLGRPSQLRRSEIVTENEMDIVAAISTAAQPPQQIYDPRCVRRQAAILLFGRVRDRTTISYPFEHHVRALRRVRGDIERHVIQPNSHLYNFTVIVRVEDTADVTLCFRI